MTSFFFGSWLYFPSFLFFFSILQKYRKPLFSQKEFRFTHVLLPKGIQFWASPFPTLDVSHSFVSTSLPFPCVFYTDIWPSGERISLLQHIHSISYSILFGVSKLIQHIVSIITISYRNGSNSLDKMYPWSNLLRKTILNLMRTNYNFIVIVVFFHGENLPKT